ncbi:hypothetical protein [Streptomyces noursei]|uniref:Uncharacterized protein n=1 Tax=Streptomyces noursei TaxID=1971 RepID=A0A2N8PQV0_STRNR|nr:hypothetical protein [Streptomyces noursei]PNE43398.1 hypothetical protein AOB60_00160 [Streptomyces noursei]
MSLSAFKRRIRVGQQLTVVNTLCPNLSGERTVHQVQARGLQTLAAGATDPWFVRWPAQGEWRIEGDTLHFIDPENPDRIFFSYIFAFDAVEQTESEATVESDGAPKNEAEPGSGLSSYSVTWSLKGKDQSSTETCIVDSDQMSRPSDQEQLRGLLRRMLAILHLPIGQVVPDNIVLLDVVPICNCAPFPGERCRYTEHNGYRFGLESSAHSGFEAIHDRADGRVLAVVTNTLSVEILTLVREKYGHQ